MFIGFLRSSLFLEKLSHGKAPLRKTHVASSGDGCFCRHRPRTVLAGCDPATSAPTAVPEHSSRVPHPQPANARPRYAFAIHGGAGVILRENLNKADEEAYRAKLKEALLAGERVLKADGQAVDAVVAAIQVMEESELFNAARGSVFTHEGHNEMDAAIMRGLDLNAGSVAGVSTIRSPIAAARAVMTDSPHVMLSGPGAEEFARSVGLAIVSPDYFHTERRWQQLKKAQSTGAHASLEHSDFKFGTVGAVALDHAGNLAAGTSTGGMTNKRWGRIGDSPVIGAGTYASNRSCAVSATGHGEYFIRRTVARDICALVEFAEKSLKEAAQFVVQDQLREMGGDGGVIAVDPKGNIVFEFNSPGMYRASGRAGEAPTVQIFRQPPP